MIRSLTNWKQHISPERTFMLSVLIVNGGNYLYNLLLGRILGPKEFADAATLITLLLVISFIGMTFQLTTAKYTALLTEGKQITFLKLAKKYAVWIGLIAGTLLIVSAQQLQLIFHVEPATMFVLLGIGTPIYFYMSCKRGVFQGKREFKSFSITYQAEMWSRLILTFLLLYVLQSYVNSSSLVAVGIVCSFVFALYPFKRSIGAEVESEILTSEDGTRIKKFLLLTAFYELTQIVINNSDVLMVKSYFGAYDAGLYASLALIGRVVYFIAWMFVMLLLPTVVQKNRDGEPHVPILLKYVTYIALLAAFIVGITYLFPQLIVNLMFGSQYISVAPLLWQYALATSIFAISNIFAYYFLSLDKYVPVIISGILGATQVALIAFYHTSLEEVIQVQIAAMSILLFVQLSYFLTINWNYILHQIHPNR